MTGDQIIGLIFVVCCALYYILTSLPYILREIRDAWKDAFKEKE